MSVVEGGKLETFQIDEGAIDQPIHGPSSQFLVMIRVFGLILSLDTVLVDLDVS
jgi:hypothetical protein